MRIPLFELNWDENEERAVLEVMRSGWISMGPKTREYEAALARFYGVRFALAASSGTSALLLAYMSLDLKGYDVILPSLTFVATANALTFVGARPVFADIRSPDMPLMSAETVERVLTSKTKAVVFVSYAGYGDTLSEVKDLCESKGIILIEDASHSHGAKYPGGMAGTFGKVGAFSTFANKNLSTGEGGYLITDDPQIYAWAKLLRSHGMTSSSWERLEGKEEMYDVVAVGLNLRPDEIRSAIGLENLKKLPAENRRRRNLVSLYRKLIAKELPEVSVPFPPSSPSAHYIFPVLLPEGVDRDVVRKRMYEAGIYTSIHYPPVHRFKVYDTGITLPNTEEYAQRTLTLPLWGRMDRERVVRVVETLKLVLRRV
ncbi:MAG: DegT/DnrJ/EryC1/StrS family aminotransferase [Thermotogae bacterium]|nr:DegT/DnrJ/EryC1/StrS family aminotransferase [Thermotogota bacterium]